MSNESFVIDHSSVLPLHYQVEDLLRKLIEQPEYQNGKLLPNEVDIAKKLGVDPKRYAAKRDELAGKKQ